MDRAQLVYLGVPVVAYLLGSIPFGLLVGSIFGGKDVRKAGSGNIGATNVSRVAGPLAGILTLLLDAAKGALAVLTAARLTGDSATWMMIAGILALLGHCYPVWLHFKGGKGVATAAGIFLVLSPLAMFSALAVFILVVVFWRFVSLGSLAAAAAIPLLMYFLWAPHHAPPLLVSFGSLGISTLVIYKHDANMQRLIEGTETKFSFSKRSREPNEPQEPNEKGAA
ncbi:MAG: glycerol-3-phosphate 1-O-acyltransferase PlsY [Candidatus Acidiferrum sp.]|jgi:glycerol-3-phosphate acyltransferase PlsY